MSRKGNAIGNRLGISKEWITQYGFWRQDEQFKKSFFIQKIITNYLEKFSI